MKLTWSTSAWADYQDWLATDLDTFQRINTLIKDCVRTPFSGLGKPEPLKGVLSGWWSRRINRSDRLVYRVSGKGDEQPLEIAACKLHY